MPATPLSALLQKLNYLEVNHLRRHIAELIERLDNTEEECFRAKENAQYWRENSMRLLDTLREEFQAIGQPVTGQLCVTAEGSAFQVPELRDGEFYCGIAIEAGRPHHHLIGLPIELEAATWNEAIEQQDEGKVVPTRRELALAWANAPEFFKREWYWSCEQHASDADFAWCQDFDDGAQDCTLKGFKLRVRFFRRLPI